MRCLPPQLPCPAAGGLLMHPTHTRSLALPPRINPPPAPPLARSGLRHHPSLPPSASGAPQVAPDQVICFSCFAGHTASPVPGCPP